MIMFPSQLLSDKAYCKFGCLPKQKLKDCLYCTCEGVVPPPDLGGFVIFCNGAYPEPPIYTVSYVSGPTSFPDATGAASLGVQVTNLLPGEYTVYVTAPLLDPEFVVITVEPLADILVEVCLLMLPFIMRIKTDNSPVGSSTSFALPITGIGYNYDIDWGDGTIDYGVTGAITHDYLIAGTYDIKIRGLFPRIYFNDSGDKLKVLQVRQRGGINWDSFNRAFWGCANMDVVATDVPIFVGPISLGLAFAGCTSLIGASLASWDTTGMGDLTRTFFQCSLFNANIGGWDTSNVTTMFQTFLGCSNFNQDISSWDTGSVTTMNAMFFATPFNQPIGSWDVSNVSDFRQMFQSATAFNQPLNSWDTSSATNMLGMFCSSPFNQPLSNWDVSNVTTMDQMFYQATLFNQDLGNWAPLSNLNFDQFLDATALSQANYDNLLLGWGSLVGLQTGRNFSALGKTFSFGAPQAARQNIITTYGWSFFDGGPL